MSNIPNKQNISFNDENAWDTRKDENLFDIYYLNLVLDNAHPIVDLPLKSTESFENNISYLCRHYDNLQQNNKI
jgi:hypothetical protein